MKLYTVGILGATGAVGQEMMNLLEEPEEMHELLDVLTDFGIGKNAAKTYNLAKFRFKI